MVFYIAEKADFKRFNGEKLVIDPWGGGEANIYTGKGCVIFWGAFSRVENKF